MVWPMILMKSSWNRSFKRSCSKSEDFLELGKTYVNICIYHMEMTLLERETCFRIALVVQFSPFKWVLKFEFFKKIYFSNKFSMLLHLIFICIYLPFISFKREATKEAILKMQIQDLDLVYCSWLHDNLNVQKWMFVNVENLNCEDHLIISVYQIQVFNSNI